MSLLQEPNGWLLAQCHSSLVIEEEPSVNELISLTGHFK